MKNLYGTTVFVFIFLNSFAQSCPGLGSINFQRWNNITGSSVSNLTSNPNYPNNPSSSGTYNIFEIPGNSGNNFGMKIYGYICPPLTGSYVFWIASDESAELWLSTTIDPANKARIAYNTSATKSRQWNKSATQKSNAIPLLAGQKYYIEALMKEGTGSDNLAVGWAKPGQSVSAPGEVIPGSYLSVNNSMDTEPPTAPSNLTSSNITTSSFTLSWTTSTDNVGVTGYDVYQDGIKINTSNITSTSYNVSGLAVGTTYSYFVKAKDAVGNQSTPSTSLNVTTNSPDSQPPTAPSNLAAANIVTTSFTFSWSASTDNVGVTGYDVYRNGVKMNSATLIGTSYSVTGLLPNTTYSMTVVAKDALGNQSTSIAMSVSTIPKTLANESFSVRTVIGNQRMPHDLVYGPDNNIWYTERFAGRVSYVNPVTNLKTIVLTLGSKMVRAGGQDGLMGLALHPEFLTGKPYAYISYTYQSLSSTVRKIRIERYTYNFSTLVLESPDTILENIPGSNDHNSARLSIGPDLKLYYSAGDMGAGQFDNISRANNAQNINIYEGKILRLNTEPDAGSWIPSDNPFTNGGQTTAVYTLGHRNPQGLVWGIVNGADILYSSEHGPFSDDEINAIQVGQNYGWPQVAGYCDGNYNGKTIGGFAVVNEQNNCATLNAKEPLRSIFPSSNPPTGGDNMTWPSIGPSGTEFYGSLAIPGWQNSLLVATLKGGVIARYKLSNDGQSIISDTINYFRGMGRYRDIVVSPDGLKLYVACDSSGSTSGPTGNVTTTPANPGSILEFTYQTPGPAKAMSQLLTESKVSDDLKDKSIDVYPNPARTYFIIYNYAVENRMVQLFDISGKLVRNIQTRELATRVDINNLSNGIYVLRVKGANGKNIRTEKVVIAR